MHTILLTDAHGGVTSIQCSVPGTRDHALVRESHHYRLGLMRDLAMWFCWSELSPITWPGNLGPDRSLLASAAKARSNITKTLLKDDSDTSYVFSDIKFFFPLNTLSCWWNSLFVLEIGSRLYFSREMKQNNEYLGDFFWSQSPLDNFE